MTIQMTMTTDDNQLPKTNMRPLRGAKADLRASTNAVIATYDPQNASHHNGFIVLLPEQGAKHGHIISPDNANAVAGIIGDDINVNILSAINDGTMSPVAMATTTEADYAHGRFLFLEDIITRKEFRNLGYGSSLMYFSLLEAFDRQLTGFAWETGRTNFEAHPLFKKIDAHFNIDNLHNVWSLTEGQVRDNAVPAQPGARTHLATRHDLNAIIQTLKDQPGVDFPRMSAILGMQEHNGFRNDSFVVASSIGGLAVASKGYSTFKVSKRSDVRLYLPKADKQNLTELIQTVSSEITGRGWRGAMHIEFSDNVVGIDKRKLEIEKEKIAKAQEILKEAFGAETLMHAGSPMVSYALYGKRYINAVINAAKKMPSRPLSEAGVARLIAAADQYGLAYSPSV